MENTDINKILKNSHGMLLAYDHGFEHGPEDFDERSADPSWIMDIASSGFFTGVICQKGIAAKYYNSAKHNVPLILKLNGKTPFHKDVGEDPISLQNCSVEEAISIGAVGVGYTIYVGSDHEQEMIQEFSKIEEEAHKKGLFVMGWMYPRGHHLKSDTDSKVLEYCSRLGLELNCDAVKIKYTGDVESYKSVVKVAGKTKVFVVGGAKSENEEDVYNMAREIITAGATGLAVGRNIWQAGDPLKVAENLANIIYK